MEFNYGMKFGDCINMVFILKLEMNVKILNIVRVRGSSGGMLFYLTTL